MAPLAGTSENRLVETVGQSLPVDVTLPYNADTLKDKTILVTGGSTGLGAAFSAHWAKHGAHIIIGDINDKAGEELIAELRTTTKSDHHHFVHCDVTDWQSQVALFQTAVKLSARGELDHVVASAGISDKDGTVTGKGFENPKDMDTANPPPPSLKCIEVNLKGMLYTAHLALFWLQQNSNEHSTTPASDRHLLMIGSSAGLGFLPGVPEYVTSKHGVTGLFRSLRSLTYRQGIRVNMLCPYFVDTPLMPNRAMILLAGLGLGSMDDVVDAATRLMASEPRISGRALVVGPKMPLKDTGDAEAEAEEMVDAMVRAGKGQAVWECYAHDYDSVDFFVLRYVRLLNTIAKVKGWIVLVKDMINVLFYREDKKKQM